MSCTTTTLDASVVVRTDYTDIIDSGGSNKVNNNSFNCLNIVKNSGRVKINNNIQKDVYVNAKQFSLV